MRQPKMDNIEGICMKLVVYLAMITILPNALAFADKTIPVVGAKCDDSACLEVYLTPLLANSDETPAEPGTEKHRKSLKKKLKVLINTKYDLGYGMDFGVHTYVKGFEKRGHDIGIAKSLNDHSSLSFNLRKPGINWTSDQKAYRLNFRLAADDDSKENAQILFGISSDW